MIDPPVSDPAVSDPAVSDPAVSVSWLASHLHDSCVAIADCRFSLADPSLGRQQYIAGHIPGAYYFDLNVDLSSAVQQHGGRHPLPDSQELAAKLAAAGVTDHTLVVAYDDSRFAFAARFWWLLRYLGHKRVAVLDGGWSGWTAARLPVTDEIPAPRVGSLVTHPQTDWVVDIEAVRSHKDRDGVVLIDSREGDRYRGEREPIDPVAGHIPGAVNYPWLEVTNEQGRLRPIQEQQQRWQGLQSGSTTERSTASRTTTDGSDLDAASAKELIVYCGSGVTACVNLLSLELAGIQGAKLYSGSWSDWCSYL